MNHPVLTLIFTAFSCSWGFFAHQRINRLAVFSLPPEMVGFYKANIEYIREVAVNPDRRRFSMPEEAPRHYIDLDHYSDSAMVQMPRSWNEAAARYSPDTLEAYGIVPWHINRMYYHLREAFLQGDPEKILKISAEMGHYVGDAHVPLHTTENYNGQLSGQEGIHGFWESRLPELFADDFNLLVGKAAYITNPQEAAWNAVYASHYAVDSVLLSEKHLSQRTGDKKYAFETKGRQTVKVYSRSYSEAYANLLDGMVERRMRAAIKMTASLWYTAWIDAGQPDIRRFINHRPTEAALAQRQKEIAEWKVGKVKPRPHETEE